MASKRATPKSDPDVRSFCYERRTGVMGVAVVGMRPAGDGLGTVFDARGAVVVFPVRPTVVVLIGRGPPLIALMSAMSMLSLGRLLPC